MEIELIVARSLCLCLSLLCSSSSQYQKYTQIHFSSLSLPLIMKIYCEKKSVGDSIQWFVMASNATATAMKENQNSSSLRKCSSCAFHIQPTNVTNWQLTRSLQMYTLQIMHCANCNSHLPSINVRKEQTEMCCNRCQIQRCVVDVDACPHPRNA